MLLFDALPRNRWGLVILLTLSVAFKCKAEGASSSSSNTFHNYSWLACLAPLWALDAMYLAVAGYVAANSCAGRFVMAPTQGLCFALFVIALVGSTIAELLLTGDHRCVRVCLHVVVVVGCSPSDSLLPNIDISPSRCWLTFSDYAVYRVVRCRLTVQCTVLPETLRVDTHVLRSAQILHGALAPVEHNSGRKVRHIARGVKWGGKNVLKEKNSMKTWKREAYPISGDCFML